MASKLSFVINKKDFLFVFIFQLIKVFIDITPNWFLFLHNELKTYIKPPKNVANHLCIRSRQKANSCNNESSTTSKFFVWQSATADPQFKLNQIKRFITLEDSVNLSLSIYEIFFCEWSLIIHYRKNFCVVPCTAYLSSFLIT